MKLLDRFRVAPSALSPTAHSVRASWPSSKNLTTVVAVGFAVCATFGITGAAASVLDIKTLSTHADRVSGGDVLVQITLDQSQAVAVTLNGNDVSSAFHPGTTPNTLVGLVTGLNLGRNTLAAQDKSLVITNYSIKGPIVSGPYIQPCICTTQTFQLPDGTTLGPRPMSTARRRRRSTTSTCPLA